MRRWAALRVRVLELLVVEASHRRRGVGTMLFRAWEESASTEKLFTSTNESNIPMQRLCEGLGYVRTGLIENLDEGDPEVFYFKMRQVERVQGRPD